MASNERTPLVNRRSASYTDPADPQAKSSSSGEPDEQLGSSEEVKLKRHITLPYAIFIIFGNVVGSGIFVSPKGVAENIGSVGGSLVIWALTGLYNLAQALCYAELGTVIPRSGGDYAFIYFILGPLPAFLCGWVHVAIIASSSCAVIARTGALYLLQPLGLDCEIPLITLIAIFAIGRSGDYFIYTLYIALIVKIRRHECLIPYFISNYG